MKRYFELEDDVAVAGRWFLNGVTDDAGTELDSRDFTYGLPLEVNPALKVSLSNEYKTIAVKSPIRVSLSRHGEPLDFTYASFDMPVVTANLGQMLAETAVGDIQRIPAQVESRDEPYEIINVTSRLACIDAGLSKIMWWTEADGRPDKVGKPRMVSKLVIDKKCVGASQIFRPDGWEVVLIVSDAVKTVLEAARISGVKFREV